MNSGSPYVKIFLSKTNHIGISLLERISWSKRTIQEKLFPFVEENELVKFLVEIFCGPIFIISPSNQAAASC